MLEIETLHHVSVPVSDLDRARTFYTQVLGLEETVRPAFPFRGAWYRVGDRTLHLIVAEKGEPATFREDKGIDSHDTHLAIRVRSYRRAVEYLLSKGYRASDERNPPPGPGRSAAHASQPIGPGGLSADLHSGSRSERDRDQRRDRGLKQKG